MNEPKFTRLVNRQRSSYTPPQFLRITYPSVPVDLYPSGTSKLEAHCSEVVNGHLVAREKNLSPTMEGPQGVPDGSPSAAAERAEGRRLALRSDLPPLGLVCHQSDERGSVPMFLRRQAD